MNRRILALSGTIAVLAVALFFFGRKAPREDSRRPSGAEIPRQEAAAVRKERKPAPGDVVPRAVAPPPVPPAAKPGMTPERAVRELEEARRMTDLSMKRIRCGNILTQLARAGFIMEAISLASPEPGALRYHELSRIMDGEMVPAELRLQAINSLMDAKDQRAAINGFCSTLGIDDLLGKDSVHTGLLATAEMRSMYAAESASRIGGTMMFLRDTQPEGYRATIDSLMERTAEMARSHEIGAEELARVFRQDQDGSAFARWQLISGINFAETDASAAELRRNIASSMMMADSGKAMDVFAEDPTGAGLPDGIHFWYQQDPGGANRWLQETGVNLPAEQRDKVLATVVRIAVKDQDMATARSWAERITDPGVKSAALGGGE